MNPIPRYSDKQLTIAMDASKIAKVLNWTSTETFENSILNVEQWYLDNQYWFQQVQDVSYKGAILAWK